MIYILFSWFRFYKDKIEHLLHLTERFVWEDMPARDLATGHITMAGSVQRAQTYVKLAVAFMFVFQGTQSSLHMWKNHDMVFTTWYPFDVSYSPVYEIVNVTQVTISDTTLRHKDKIFLAGTVSY